MPFLFFWPDRPLTSLVALVNVRLQTSPPVGLFFLEAHVGLSMVLALSYERSASSQSTAWQAPYEILAA